MMLSAIFSVSLENSLPTLKEFQVSIVIKWPVDPVVSELPEPAYNLGRKCYRCFDWLVVGTGSKSGHKAESRSLLLCSSRTGSASICLFCLCLNVQGALALIPGSKEGRDHPSPLTPLPLPGTSECNANASGICSCLLRMHGGYKWVFQEGEYGEKRLVRAFLGERVVVLWGPALYLHSPHVPGTGTWVFPVDQMQATWGLSWASVIGPPEGTETSVEGSQVQRISEVQLHQPQARTAGKGVPKGPQKGHQNITMRKRQLWLSARPTQDTSCDHLPGSPFSPTSTLMETKPMPVRGWGGSESVCWSPWPCP